MNHQTHTSNLYDVEKAMGQKVNPKGKVILKPKRKYPGFRKNLRHYVKQFCDSTGIHGFKYMGEPNRSIFEKIWWATLFCISLTISIILIRRTWKKWNDYPVLVSFAKSPTPIWNVPFPAITVCPENKLRQRVYNFTGQLMKMFFDPSNFTEEDTNAFYKSTFICNAIVDPSGNETIDLDTIDDLMRMAPQLNDTFQQCVWLNLQEYSKIMFTPILTQDGLCFTFNILDRSELFNKNVYFHGKYGSHENRSEGWKLEGGYKKTARRHTYPRRTFLAGPSAGLKLYLTSFEEDLDYVCRGPVQGFKIFLHHPAEIPRTNMQYFLVTLNQDVVVSVKPDMMTTSDGLKYYKAHRKQCYDERNLFFYQRYTQQNCQVECLTNYTLEKCGCVGYFMPYEEGTPICGTGKQPCMDKAYDDLVAHYMESGISNTENQEDYKKISSQCDCLPACTSLVYNAETSQGDVNWGKYFETFGMATRERMHIARVLVFFKEQEFITSERNELYGSTDFLANCGGILGLFTGFSFMSIIEILYFLSLRLMCNLKRYGLYYWSGSRINDYS